MWRINLARTSIHPVMGRTGWVENDRYSPGPPRRACPAQNRPLTASQQGCRTMPHTRIMPHTLCPPGILWHVPTEVFSPCRWLIG